MLLSEFFNSLEGDSYARSTPTTRFTKANCTKKKETIQKKSNMVENKAIGSQKVSKKTYIKEDQWSGPNNAWNNGEDQWSDGRGQWDESIDDTETITLDSTLLMRLLDYARNESTTDNDFHNIISHAIALSQDGRTLTVNDYDKICSTKELN